MSDIKPGDLVMVVRWPCCQRKLGVIYKVAGFNISPRLCQCAYCLEFGPREPTAYDSEFCHSTPVSWLLKIDPPAIPEAIERKEELPA